MIRMKKIALLLALLIVVSGCGGGPTKTKPQAKNENKKQESDDSNKKKQGEKEDEDPEFRIVKPDNPAAVSRLEDLAEHVELDSDEHVIAVSFGKLELDQQLKLAGRFKHVTSVNFAGKVKDEHLAAIAHLEKLESLVLTEAEITDKAMDHIAKFTKLKVLRMPGAKISDDGWAKLAPLQELHTLDLMYTDISDKSVSNILQLPKLKTLDVSFTKVSKLSVDALSKLKQLERIDAIFSDIDDEQIADIRKQLPKIVINGVSGDALAANKKEDEAEKPLTPEQLAIGKEVPEITGEGIDGQEMKLSDFRGKVVLIDFYGFWCPPCVEAIPKLRKLADEMKARSFVLVGVNSDGVRKELPDLIKKQKMTWRSWFEGSGGPIARRWNIKSWPTTYVIDHKGIIRHVNLRGDALAAAVKKLVDEVDKAKKREKKK